MKYYLYAYSWSLCWLLGTAAQHLLSRMDSEWWVLNLVGAFITVALVGMLQNHAQAMFREAVEWISGSRNRNDEGGGK